MDADIYQRAERFLPWNLQSYIFNSTIFPYWGNSALYYFRESESTRVLIKIDLVSGKKEQVIDLQQIMNELSSKVQESVTSMMMPLDAFSIQADPIALRFRYKNEVWCYDLSGHTCTKEASHLGRLQSPDKKWELWVRDNNLVLTESSTGDDYQLTDDGEPYYDYASSPETNTSAVTRRLQGFISPPVAIWSPDSKKIVTHRLDQRNVNKLHLMQNAPDGEHRPKTHTYRMSFSGDAELPLEELLIVDVETKKIMPVKAERLLAPYLTPIEFKWVWWDETSDVIYFLRETRGAKALILCMAEAKGGASVDLLKETAETYVEPSQIAPWPRQVIIIKNRHEIIWLSERSGFSHLYLFDTGSEEPKCQITQGEWCVRELHFYDEQEDWIYFTACGYEREKDPYYKKLYRCHLDGSDLTCLTIEDAHHYINIAPEHNAFLDTYSTINSAPVSILRKMDGSLICDVEVANIEKLINLGWTAPQRLKQKARDGETDLYCNLYYPSSFDPNRKYPIIDHIYPGPQFYRTPTHFSIYSAIFRSAWTAQALAELGFIVMHLDGLGTPGRSKEFHDVTYENMGDCSLADHVAVIQQLAKKFDYIDIKKVGIVGYSGGGYAAARAMLVYPDFFKVGVSAGGNHDLRSYPANYGEKYNGLDASTYADQSNASLAYALKGRLLLIHGEMDDNVHPCATYQLVDALIANNKDFDMLIIPNQNHTTTFDHPYYLRKQWDYFITLLKGEVLPSAYLTMPMPLDFPQLCDW